SKSVIILSLALISNGLFHFFEIYAPDSGIPFGLVFMFFGMLLLLTGAYLLMRELKRVERVSHSLVRLVQALFGAALLFCISPFVSGLLSDTAATPLLVLLMMAVGWLWSGIGLMLLKAVRKRSAIGKKAAV